MTMPYNPWFEETLIVDPAGVAESKVVTFDFTDNPQLTAFSDSIVSSPAPAISWVNPSGQVTLLYTTPTVSGDHITTQLTTNGTPAYVGKTPYVVTIRAYTSQGQILEKNCTLSLDAPGYTPFNPGPPIVPNGPTGNFSGLQLNDGIVSITPTFQFKSTDIASVTAAGTFISPGYTATDIELASSGQVLGLTATPTTLPRYLTANIPAASSVPPSTVIQVTDGVMSRLASNGTNWVDISGGVAYSRDFNDDPTGATTSWTAWQAALTALSNAGGGDFVINTLPNLTDFYIIDRPLIRQPAGNRLNTTINIIFKGFQNQIRWRGPAYTPFLISIGMYNSNCIGVSPDNDQNVNGFIAFDHRDDYWQPAQTQLKYEHCNPNLGSSAINCIGFRTAQGPGVGTGGLSAPGESLDHGWFSHCNVTCDSNANLELAPIAFQLGGVNSIPLRLDHVGASNPWWFFMSGGLYTIPTSPLFTSQSTTLNVFNTTGFYPGSASEPGYLLISQNPLSSPYELVSYTGVTGTNPSSTNTTTGPITNPTVAPGLSTASSGGTWTQQTVWVAYSIVDSHGETLPSPTATITVPANGTLTITGPSSLGDATGWYLYIGTGTYQTQNYQLFRQGGLQSFSPSTVTLTTNPTAAAFTGVTRGLNGTTPINATGGTTITQWATDTLVSTLTTATVNTGPSTINVGSTTNFLSAGQIQINSGPTSAAVLAGSVPSGIGASCVPYQTISYTGKTSTTLTGCSGAQLGSYADTYPFVLPVPFSPVPTIGSGSWSASTAWVQVTWVNANGETLPSAIVSKAVGASGSLIVPSPDATTWTSNSPATGWYLYIGTGATQPANSAMYRQGGLQTLGSPVTISSNPSTGTANPPTTNTASGGNGFAVFQRLYAPSPGAIVPAGIVNFVNPSSFGASNCYSLNGTSNITIINDECEGVRGQYLSSGLINQGAGGSAVSSVNIIGGRVFSASPNPAGQNLFYFTTPTSFRMLGGTLAGNANGSFTTLSITTQRPCTVRLSGVFVSATDPFIGDPSLQSQIVVEGCVPITYQGNVVTLGQFFSSPALPTIFLTDLAPPSLINITCSDQSVYYLLMTAAIPTRNINFQARRPGEMLRLILQQPASGGPCAVSWQNTMIWDGGSAPVLNPAASSFTIIDVMPIQTTPGGVVTDVYARVNRDSWGPSDGAVLVNSSVNGIGYSTGAGGTVTQLSSKSTSVTLNSLSGQITLNSAALSGGASVTFTWNNTSLQSNDTIRWQVVGTSANDPSAYYVMASNITANTSCSVTVRNLSGGSLSEAVVLQFNVLRGATS